MLIGEISKKTQLSRDTIRFYEKKGLIKARHANSEFNNYKNYTEENLQRLMLIKKAKKIGFTLNEIAEILDLIKINKASCSTFRKKVMAKIEDIDKKIQELEEMKLLISKRIQDALINCKNEQENGNCGELN